MICKTATLLFSVKLHQNHPDLLHGVRTNSVVRLKPPKQFSFGAEKWPEWVKEFGRFRNASKLSKEDGVTQRDTVLCVMGPESEKIFHTLTFDERTVGEGADAKQEMELDTDSRTLCRPKFDRYFFFHLRARSQRVDYSGAYKVGSVAYCLQMSVGILGTS